MSNWQPTTGAELARRTQKRLNRIERRSGKPSGIAPTSLLPTGMITPFAAATPPDGWLKCDGAEVSRTTYAQLFGVIGTQFGAGNGTTTFNLPNLGGRMAVGVNSDPSFDVVGETGGEKTHVLTTAEMPSHTHGPLSGSEILAAAGTGTAYIVQNGAFYGFKGQATTGATGGGGAHNNMPPYIALTMIIKA